MKSLKPYICTAVLQLNTTGAKREGMFWSAFIILYGNLKRSLLSLHTVHLAEMEIKTKSTETKDCRYDGR